MADHYTRSPTSPIPPANQATSDPISSGTISGDRRVALEIRHIIAHNAVVIRLSTRTTLSDLGQSSITPNTPPNISTPILGTAVQPQHQMNHIQLVPSLPQSSSAIAPQTPYQPFKTHNPPPSAVPHSAVTESHHASEAMAERVSSSRPPTISPTGGSATVDGPTTISPQPHDTSVAPPTPPNPVGSQSGGQLSERNNQAALSPQEASTPLEQNTPAKDSPHPAVHHSDEKLSESVQKVSEALLHHLEKYGENRTPLQSDIPTNPPTHSTTSQPSSLPEERVQAGTTPRETTPEEQKNSPTTSDSPGHITTPESPPNRPAAIPSADPIMTAPSEPVGRVIETIRQREQTDTPNLELRLTPESSKQPEHSHTSPQNSEHSIAESPKDSHHQHYRDQLNSRVERLRDIQQIGAAERQPTNLTPPENRSNEQENRPVLQPGRTTSGSERIRESIIDRLSDLQAQLIPYAPDTSQREHLRVSTDTSIQGRSMLTRPETQRNDFTRAPSVTMAERFKDTVQPSRPVREPLVGLSRTITTEHPFALNAHSNALRATPSPISNTLISPRSSANTERISGLLDILKRFSERSVNFKLLGAMDTSLEKACLTIATGAALGFVGASLLYRATNLAVIHTLRALRERESEEMKQHSDDEQIELEHNLESDLAEFACTELSAFGERGFVVDLAGVVVDAQTEQPLEAVKVSCAEFGICLTDQAGRFMFSNIPLGTPYTITVESPTKKLRPLVIAGVCGELEFLHIRAEPI